MNFITHLFRIAKYGTSYAIATGFFPKKTAKKVLLLYSFVRIPDNIVDDVSSSWGTKDPVNQKSLLQSHYKQAKKKLITLKNSRTQAYTNNLREDAQRGQYVSLFQDNNIPFQYSIDFFKAMIDDCTVHRYKTYEQLEWYMYGSASVVGLMMCHIIWFIDKKYEKKAKSYATVLWNAMQLTNFLRDVREDFEELDRIYIPISPLEKGGRGDPISNRWSSPTLLAKEEVLHDDIISFCHWGYSTASKEKKKARADMMKVYISKCRAMYAHSLDGLQYLNPEWRKAVRLAALLYESILDKIESNDYDVFTKSCRTNLKDKFQTLYNHNRQWK